MKIQSVRINKNRKALEIETLKGSFSLPFTKLRVKPTSKDPIQTAFVDKELGDTGITYATLSGKADSVPLDAFLDYNKEPSYMRDLFLFQLTVAALSGIKSCHLSKNEITRRLKTSPSQLHRLLDTTNYKKSVDEMLRLLEVLGYEVEMKIKRRA